jgi:class 3 adenylate cyclase
VPGDQLPTGTITFLFSDMVRSTRLVADLGPAVFRDVLERHNGILRSTFAAHGGIERGTQGDSFLVMFREAPTAVAAAAAAQRELHAVDWPGGADVRVRMGLHTGIGTLGGDDYVGLDVNRAARIAGTAHGGQVLLSESTRVLAEASLAPDLTLRSLGEHSLRDINRPERLFQLVIEGLESDFPPLATPQTAVGSLPRRLTSFVGREQELDELARLQRIASAAVERIYLPDDALVREGDSGDELLVIAEGRVQVVRDEESGRRVLRECEAGDHIGELAVLTAKRRSATVIATASSVRGLVIQGEALRAILGERPTAAMAMLATLAERLAVSGPTGRGVQ